MSDKQGQQAAFVLHARPYRETSSLVDLFTLGEGRVSVVARGARKPGSQMRMSIQPFSLLSVSYRGRQELKTLLSAETTEFGKGLSGRALLCGLYANELIERLVYPSVAMPDLFLFYQYLLNELRSSENFEAALRTFEHQLLKDLGHWTDLSRLPAPYYTYSPDQGLIACEASQPKAMTSQCLAQIEGDQYEDESARKVAKWLMRSMLNNLLGDKPLRSRALFMKREKPNPAERMKFNEV